MHYCTVYVCGYSCLWGTGTVKVDTTQYYVYLICGKTTFTLHARCMRYNCIEVGRRCCIAQQWDHYYDITFFLIFVDIPLFEPNWRSLSNEKNIKITMLDKYNKIINIVRNTLWYPNMNCEWVCGAQVKRCWLSILYSTIYICFCRFVSIWKEITGWTI